MECYFERAVRFAPDDGQARALYADYLIKRRRTDEARDQLLSIEKIPPQQPQVLYNMGLAWFELKDYEKSLAYAKQAYAAGIQFPGLRDKLKRAGHWRGSPRHAPSTGRSVPARGVADQGTEHARQLRGERPAIEAT